MGLRVGWVGVMLMAVMSAGLPQAAQAQSGGADSAGLTLYAAGSLRAALTRIAAEFGQAHGVEPRLVFGASGLLRDRLRAGEKADVFASANMEHPQSLQQGGQAQRVQPFTRNELCALAQPAFAADPRPLVDKLLDSRVKLGISTPKADPSGDYAFEMFERIESAGLGPAGSTTTLKSRALQLTGGPQSPPPPANRSVYGELVAAGQADVFITYCTNAALALTEQPQLRSLPIDPRINVAATYGVALMKGASPLAERFVAHLLGPQGQERLRALGFSPVP